MDAEMMAMIGQASNNLANKGDYLSNNTNDFDMFGAQPASSHAKEEAVQAKPASSE
jgi:hypothetical protein